MPLSPQQRKPKPPATNATTTNRRFQIGPKLISYITSKYASKSDLIYDETLWAEIIGSMLPRTKEAGALRQVVSRVWNKEVSLILVNAWEYVDGKAFVACQALFREAEAELAKLYDISQIITASRSVILPDVQLQTRYVG